MASAYQRKESRGLHYNADYPQLAEQGASTVIIESFRRRHRLSFLPPGAPVQGTSNLVPAPAGNNLEPKSQRDLAYRGGKSSLMTSLLLAEGTHHTGCL